MATLLNRSFRYVFESLNTQARFELRDGFTVDGIVILNYQGSLQTANLKEKRLLSLETTQESSCSAQTTESYSIPINVS